VSFPWIRLVCLDFDFCRRRQSCVMKQHFRKKLVTLFNSTCPSQIFENSPEKDACSKNNETWSIAHSCPVVPTKNTSIAEIYDNWQKSIYCLVSKLNHN
jgi:hypothetical protein